MSRFHDRVDRILHASVVLLGAWTLYAQICVLARASFATLRAFAWLPLLACILVGRSTSGAEATPEPPASRPLPARRRLPDGIRLAIPFAITALYVHTRSERLFWLLATLDLTAEVWFGPAREPAAEPPTPSESRVTIAAVMALCALAAILTSGSWRPDADDAYYLNVTAAELESPEAPLQSVDALHHGGLPPVVETLHLPETYELLVGLLANLFGVSAAALYYLVLPPLWAVLGTLATWLVLRHVLPRYGALAGTAVSIFVLAFSGDGHRTFGNFGFVRLFQGKAVYLVVALPLLVLAALRYREQPGRATWLRFAATQCAAVGFTTNAIIVAPVAAALAMLAPRVSAARSLRTTVLGLAASAPVLSIAAAMYPRLAPYRAAMTGDGVVFGYAGTLGANRTPLVLLAITLLPALAARARSKHADWIAGYVWIVVLVMFMPLVPVVASKLLGDVYSWRLMWAVPVPLLLGLAGGIAAGAVAERRWVTAAGLAAVAIAFAVAGPRAVSANVFSLRNFGRLKVADDAYAAAEQVLALAPRDAPALAPEVVASCVASFPHAPPLVGVRDLYLAKLRSFIPSDEFTSRSALLRYIGGEARAVRAVAALRMITAKGVATVVFATAHRDAAALTSALQAGGFVIHPVQGYLIAVRPRENAPLAVPPGA